MRVTPPVRCIVKIFSVFAAAFSLAFISCAANDDSASLTIQMPGSSSSRAISSEGQFELPDGANISVNVFSVYIRDSDNDEVARYTNVAPGTRLTVDSLRPGNYNVAIRAISTAATAGGQVTLYGATEATVRKNAESAVSIKLENVYDASRKILVTDQSLSQYDIQNVKITCKNGDSYNNIRGSILFNSSPAYFDLGNYFFEPNFEYNIEVTFTTNMPYAIYGDIYRIKTSAKATKDGIVFTVN